MPIWVAALLGGITESLGSWLGMILVSLGIGYVTFQGLDVGLDLIKEKVFAGFLGIPAYPLQLAGVLQIGTALNIQFSAMAARLFLTSGNASKVTKMIFKA